MKEEKIESGGKANEATSAKQSAPSVASTPVPAPGADSQKRPRFKIIDLYEPSDAMRELGLPILDWGDNPKWRYNSDEGMTISIRSCDSTNRLSLLF
jgi:hypothetical protein